MRNVFALLFASVISLNSCKETSGAKVENEISNENKLSSSFTEASNDAMLKYLNFSDTTDFQNASKGFMGTIPSGEIMHTDGSMSYSMKDFEFLKGNAPNTANPSLWRESRLNSMNGLFQVADNIYQIRGFDLANMTLIKGKTGWLIIDPLTVPTTAKAAMQLVKEKLGEFPVKALLLTHSHIDHFGGMRAFVSEEDLKSGKVKVIAPAGFFEHSISENVMGGNTMSRRAAYMYGSLLPKGATGSLGSGLGTTTAKGETGILEPTDFITKENGETRTIDGVKIDFIFTPESEAPAEMMFYFPDLKAFCQAENISHTLHNLYTLRGAQVRNGQKWSQYIDKCIYLFGKNVQVSFGSHHWPTWGNTTILSYWEKQRDLYRFIHDQTLRLANEGYTPNEIAEMLKLPEALDKEFYNRGYYGTVSHDAKAQYQLYFGWFDGNPSNLNPLPPSEAGAKYVEFMGGADKLISMAQTSFDKGEYRWVGEVMKHLVFADPKNQKARNLLADAYEQMGYQAESGPWRNFYLTGAKELRMGVKVIPMSGSSGPDMINGMSSELFFNYIAMRYKGTEENKNKYNFNFILTDRNEKASLIVSNGVVNPRIGSHLEKDVTATITMSRLDFAILTSGKGIKFDDLVKSGKIKIDGDADAFKAFLNNIDNFEYWFNIIEP